MLPMDLNRRCIEIAHDLVEEGLFVTLERTVAILMDRYDVIHINQLSLPSKPIHSFRDIPVLCWIDDLNQKLYAFLVLTLQRHAVVSLLSLERDALVMLKSFGLPALEQIDQLYITSDDPSEINIDSVSELDDEKRSANFPAATSFFDFGFGHLLWHPLFSSFDLTADISAIRAPIVARPTWITYEEALSHLLNFITSSSGIDNRSDLLGFEEYLLKHLSIKMSESLRLNCRAAIAREAGVLINNYGFTCSAIISMSSKALQQELSLLRYLSNQYNLKLHNFQQESMRQISAAYDDGINYSHAAKAKTVVIPAAEVIDAISLGSIKVHTTRESVATFVTSCQSRLKAAAGGAEASPYAPSYSKVHTVVQQLVREYLQPPKESKPRVDSESHIIGKASRKKRRKLVVSERDEDPLWTTATHVQSPAAARSSEPSLHMSAETYGAMMHRLSPMCDTLADYAMLHLGGSKYKCNRFSIDDCSAVSRVDSRTTEDFYRVETAANALEVSEQSSEAVGKENKSSNDSGSLKPSLKVDSSINLQSALMMSAVDTVPLSVSNPTLAAVGGITEANASAITTTDTTAAIATTTSTTGTSADESLASDASCKDRLEIMVMPKTADTVPPEHLDPLALQSHSCSCSCSCKGNGLSLSSSHVRSAEGFTFEGKLRFRETHFNSLKHSTAAPFAFASASASASVSGGDVVRHISNSELKPAMDCLGPSFLIYCSKESKTTAASANHVSHASATTATTANTATSITSSTVGSGSSGGSSRDAAAAAAVGRWGEALIYQYLLRAYPTSTVTWVNAEQESLASYDLIVTTPLGSSGRAVSVTYVEVKTTRSPHLNVFDFSLYEWQFATSLPRVNYHVYRVFNAPSAPTASDAVHAIVVTDILEALSRRELHLCLAV